MEGATDKQKQFMKQLGITAIPNLSKQAARELIQAKLSEDDKPEVVKMNGGSRPKNGTKAMYVSYAKDLVVSGMDVVDAIDAIKKIEGAFE